LTVSPVADVLGGAEPSTGDVVCGAVGTALLSGGFVFGFVS
jgi:hypothetical protein